MTNKFSEPRLISQEEMDALHGSIEALQALSIRTPAEVHIQETEMHVRAQDYLEVAEQDYIRGWTDCEIGKSHLDASDAYNAGYGDCYEYEQRQHSEPVIGSYEEMSKGDK